jgi:rod shape-determining protein MreC
MENFFTRYRNVTVLLGLLMAQVIVLASQVRRPGTTTHESMSLMRTWVVEVFVPAEKAISSVGSGIGNLWKNYVDLRGVRAQNAELQSQIDRLRLEEVSLAEDAGQARRLQALVGFKEKFISESIAAQVIGTSGSEHSHVLYIDKGSGDGITPDMAVITPQGIIGKISKVFPGTSQVLEINDPTAGAGIMLERSRLRGVLHGTASGIPEILHVMADEKIEIGEPVVSSGGDQIYPRGLRVGTVFSTGPDPESGPFMIVRVKPAANLDQVDEVLVITKVTEKAPEQSETAASLRAADYLARRLPTVVPKPPAKGNEEPPSTAVLYGREVAKPLQGAAKGASASSSSPGTPKSPRTLVSSTTQSPAGSPQDATSAPISEIKNNASPKSAGTSNESLAPGAESAQSPTTVQPEQPKTPKSAPAPSDTPQPQETPH